jgi:hypothetical protein
LTGSGPDSDPDHAAAVEQLLPSLPKPWCFIAMTRQREMAVAETWETR